jgi:glycerate kinase
MEKIVVVSDSFKGTLSSLEICRLARQAVSAVFPACRVDTVPVADGGEGTVDCFVEAIGAERVSVPVTGPFGEPLEAAYARKGTLAVLEMAAAAGLPLVGDRGDPERTTTYGVGQLVRHAVEHGCREILLGIGGSATNDGGCGCAAALGAVFFDETGAPFLPVGGTLDRIARIDLSGPAALLEEVRITVMCDVENPLYGPTGAAYIFGPQKGADGAMVERLDRQLRALDRCIRRELGLDLSTLPGGGAAGGMGAGCVAFLGAELRSGIEAVLDAVDFDSRLAGADLVLTGEGRIDSQSVHGKVISGVARRTGPRGLPLVALVGAIDPSASAAYGLGVTAMFGIDREGEDFVHSAPKSSENYRRTLEDILRLVRAVEPR